MKKIIISEFITLDGVIEAPNEWSFPYWNEQISNFKHDELFSVDSLLLGRVTYEGFAAAWPNMQGAGDYGVRMNTMPKHVVSTTLEKADWENTTVIKDSIVAEVQKLKEQPGQDILVFGSGKLAKFLLENNLVDQYNLLVYPVVLGKGQKLFNQADNAKLKLVRSTSFDSGVILAQYSVER